MALRVDWLRVTIMSHSGAMLFDSTCTILGCTSEYFWSIYDNDNGSTLVLSTYILTNIIDTNHERLRAADRRIRLNYLLFSMIVHVPHPLGQRYVAVSLHIAHQKGEDAVINLAKAWMEQLFFPSQFLKRFSISVLILDHSVVAISRAINTERSSSQIPEPEASDLRRKASVKFSFFLVHQGGLTACHSRGILLRNLPRIRQRSCGSTYNARSSSRYSQSQCVSSNETHPL